MRISWIGSTFLLGIFLVWGVIQDSQTLILNAGIGLAVIQVAEGFRLLRPGHSIIVAVALALHALGATTIGGHTLYAVLGHWDILTHAAGIAAATMVVWSLLKELDERSLSTKIVLSDRLVLIWAVVLALAIGATWEIVEYGLQIWLNDPVLRAGNIQDMVGDMLSGSLGALIAGVWIATTRPRPGQQLMRREDRIEWVDDRPQIEE